MNDNDHKDEDLDNLNINYLLKESKDTLIYRFKKITLIFSGLVFLISTVIIFIPLMIVDQYIAGIIVLVTINLINFAFAIMNVYEILFYWFLYATKSKRIDPKIIQNQIVLEENHLVVLHTNQKIIFKAYFAIELEDLDKLSYSEVTDVLTRYKGLLKNNNNIRFLAFDINYDVKENLDFIKKMQKSNLNVSKLNIDYLKYQEYAFNDLQFKRATNRIVVVEFSKAIDVFDKKVDINNSRFINRKIDFLKEVNVNLNFNNVFFRIKQLKSFELKQIIEKIYFKKSKTQMVANSHFIKTQKNEYIKYLKINELDYELQEGYLQSLINQDENVSISIEYNTIDVKMLDRIENIVRSRANFKAGRKAKARVLRKREIVVEYLDKILRNVTLDGDVSKSSSIIIEIKAKSKKELKDKEESIKRLFKTEKIFFHKLNFLQIEAWSDFYYGNSRSYDANKKQSLFFKIFKYERFNATELGNMWLSLGACAYGLPFEKLFDLEPDSFLLGTSNYLRPVSFNFEKNRPNKHMTIVGKSGSGKTTASEVIIRNKYLNNINKQPLILILDPKKEYENLVTELGGQLIELDQNFLNPFSIIDLSTPKTEGESKKFINSFLANLLNDLDFNVFSAIQTLLKFIFTNTKFLNKTFNFDDLYKIVIDKRNEFAISNLDYQKLKIAIEAYTTNGIYKNAFNSELSLEKSKKIICFDFSTLMGGSSDNKTRCIVLTLIQYFSIIIRNNGNEIDKQQYNITIIADEFHLLINSDESDLLRFFAELCFIARSFNASVISIFQSLAILDNPKNKSHAEGIFNTASYLHIFQLNNNDITKLQKAMSEKNPLNKTEVEFIEKNSRFESLLLIGDMREAFKWNINVLYNPKRDGNDDGLKAQRVNEYNSLMQGLEFFDKEKAKIISNRMVKK